MDWFFCIRLFSFMHPLVLLQSTGHLTFRQEHHHPHHHHHHYQPIINITHHVGSLVHLPCDLNLSLFFLNTSSHVIAWKKQDLGIPIIVIFSEFPPRIEEEYQDRLKMLPDLRTLELSDVQLSDSGIYRCSLTSLATSKRNEIVGTPVQLSVTASPTFGDKSPSFLVQQPGDDVDLFCEASGAPEPEVTWFKDGVPLVQSDKVSLYKDRILVRAVEASDGGVYECRFKNDFGQISHLIRLLVQGSMQIIDGPSNVTTTLGSKVKFKCLVEAFPSNITYNWYFNEEIIQTPVSRLLENSGVQADGGYLMKNVSEKNMGWYKCKPHNGVVQSPEASAFLNVTYAPKVKDLKLLQFVMRGLESYITCPVDANPPISTLKWFKEDKLIQVTKTESSKLEDYPNYETNFISSAGDSSSSSSSSSSLPSTIVNYKLFIRNVSEDDAGAYTCLPLSSMGAGRISHPINVTVIEPYHFVWRPSPVYQVPEGESVTLPCVLPPYTSYRPDVRWLKVDELHQNFTKRGKYELTKKIVEDHGDDYNINSINNNLNNDINNINNDNNLTIHNITKADAGTYECIASDANINSVASTRLIVQNSVLQAAHNLKVTSVENSIALSWLPAFIKGHALHYLLWYRQLKDETTEAADDNMRDSYGETDSYYKNDDYDDDNNEDEDERLDAEFDSSPHQNIPEHYKNLDRYVWQTIPIFSYDAHSSTLHGLEWNTLYEVMIMSRSLLDSTLEVFSGKTRIKTHYETFAQKSNDLHLPSTTKVGTTQRSKSSSLSSSSSSSSSLSPSSSSLSPSTSSSSSLSSPHCSSIGKLDLRLPPPSDLAVYKTRLGLNITWSFNDQSKSLISHLTICYRSSGAWSKLASTFNSNQFFFLWTEYAKSATYQFLAYAHSVNGKVSNVSNIVTFDAAEQHSASSSNFFTYTMYTMMAGVLCVVGLSLVIFILLLRTHRKKKRRRKQNRYGSIKYFGPNQTEENRATVLQNFGNNNHAASLLVTPTTTTPQTMHATTTSTKSTATNNYKETPI